MHCLLIAARPRGACIFASSPMIRLVWILLDDDDARFRRPRTVVGREQKGRPDGGRASKPRRRASKPRPSGHAAGRPLNSVRTSSRLRAERASNRRPRGKLTTCRPPAGDGRPRSARRSVCRAVGRGRTVVGVRTAACSPGQQN